MDHVQEKTKKCFCARCFLPIDADDKVDIEEQSFHKICSMCCICRTIPSCVKMFYGHVFCNECFKAHVLCKFRNECPQMHSNSWWMQLAPGAKPQQNEDITNEVGKPSQDSSKELPKRSICTRCLQPIDESNKVDIGGQNFHSQCAKCYFCHEIPSSKLKIYYGQMFCEDCFHRYVLNHGKDNPSEFFKHCFDQWQNNAHFADNMRQFMNGNKESAPFVFMMQGPQSPFCRCGTGPQEWFQQNEPKKSPDTFTIDCESFGTCNQSLELHAEVPESNDVSKESANQKKFAVAAMQKIEKMTKYLLKKNSEDKSKNYWKNFIELDKFSVASKKEIPFCGWVNLQDPKKHDAKLECPKCLWQYGPIYVNSENIQNKIVCGDF